MQRCQRFRPAEAAVKAQARYVERVDREVIMVDEFVVPGRARSVVAAVVTLHLLVRGEPVGVAVDSPHAVLRAPRRLAPGPDAVGIGSPRELADTGRDID